MKDEYKKPILIGGLMIITIVFSAFSVNYTYKELDPLNSETVLTNWNYIKTSIQLALMTLFIGISSGYHIRVQQSRKLENVELMDIRSMIGAFIFYMPFIIFLYYPGLDQLKIHSDKSAFKVIFALLAVNCTFYYIIIKLVINEKIRAIRYFLLLVLILIIIFLTPILPIGGGTSRYFDY